MTAGAAAAAKCAYEHAERCWATAMVPAQLRATWFAQWWQCVWSVVWVPPTAVPAVLLEAHVDVCCGVVALRHDAKRLPCRLYMIYVWSGVLGIGGRARTPSYDARTMKSSEPQRATATPSLVSLSGAGTCLSVMSHTSY